MTFCKFGLFLCGHCIDMKQHTQRAAPEGQWKHDLFEEGSGPAPLKPNMGIETGTKVVISNLDFGVSNEDIKVHIDF